MDRDTKRRCLLTPRDPLVLLCTVVSVFPEIALDIRATCRYLSSESSVLAWTSKRGLLCAAAALGRLQLLEALLCNPRVNPAFVTKPAKMDRFKFWVGSSSSAHSIPPHDALGHASRNGQNDAVCRLLKDPRVDPSVNESFALRVACAQGHDAVVELLLADGRADPCHPVAESEISAFILSANFGRGPIVRLLLADPRVNPSPREYSTALLLASRRGHVNVVHVLISEGRSIPAEDAFSALTEACYCGQILVVELLLHPDVNLPETLHKAIEMACENGHTAVVDRLLRDSRVNPEPTEAADLPPLWTASSSGHADVVDLLLHDDRVIWDDDNITAASRGGHVSVVQRLLEDPRADPTTDDNRPIRAAAKNGRVPVVRRLLEDPRIDPGARDNEAIRRASRRGYLAVIDLLLQDPRVDPTARNNDALYQARRKGRTAVAARLLADARVRALDDARDSADEDEDIEYTNYSDNATGDLPLDVEADAANARPHDGSQCVMQ